MGLDVYKRQIPDSIDDMIATEDSESTETESE